jgi:hypothetical protein
MNAHDADDKKQPEQDEEELAKLSNDDLSAALPADPTTVLRDGINPELP